MATLPTSFATSQRFHDWHISFVPTKFADLFAKNAENPQTSRYSIYQSEGFKPRYDSWRQVESPIRRKQH